MVNKILDSQKVFNMGGKFSSISVDGINRAVVTLPEAGGFSRLVAYDLLPRGGYLWIHKAYTKQKF